MDKNLSIRTSRQARWKQKQARRRRETVGTLALGLIGVLLLAWMVWNTKHPGQQQTVQRVNVEGTEVGQMAPDFSVPTLDGTTFTLAAHQGKPTIVFFMAYWCSTCLPEARALAQLAQEYGNQVSILAIDVDPSSTPEALRQFKSMAGDGAFTWAFDAAQRVAQSYQVASLDTTLIIDQKGYIVYRDGVPTPYRTLKEQLEKLGI